jgi:hypothetical protein
MCIEPKKQFKRIYNYLELTYFDHDFEDVRQLVPENDSHYGIFGDHQVYKGSVREPGTDARKIIGDAACNLIADSNLWFYDKFGYPMRP